MGADGEHYCTLSPTLSPPPKPMTQSLQTRIETEVHEHFVRVQLMDCWVASNRAGKFGGNGQKPLHNDCFAETGLRRPVARVMF